MAAFGFQGQKCSACSRAIVDAKVYDPFVEKLAQKQPKKPGWPTNKDPRYYMGPVISAGARKNEILEYIETGKKEGRLVSGGGRDPQCGDGYFIAPTIIADVDAKAPHLPGGKSSAQCWP